MSNSVKYSEIFNAKTRITLQTHCTNTIDKVSKLLEIFNLKLFEIKHNDNLF